MSTQTRGLVGIILCAVLIPAGPTIMAQGGRSQSTNQDSTANNAVQLVVQGRQIFRFDTFGDQAYWGDTLKLHQAIEGSGLGRVGPEVSPKTAERLAAPDGGSGITSSQMMDEAEAAGRAVEVGSNFFLFFSSEHESKSAAEQNMHHHPASPDLILAAGR